MAFRKANTTGNNNESPKFTVIEECGTVYSNNGWDLKLRFGSWSGGKEKYDLRYWKVGEDGEEKCRKGMTFTGEELEALQRLLDKMSSEE